MDGALGCTKEDFYGSPANNPRIIVLVLTSIINLYSPLSSVNVHSSHKSNSSQKKSGS